MKVDGIPSNVSVNHSHHVETHNAIDVQVSRETAANIKDVLHTMAVLSVSVYAAKKSIDIVQRGGFELIMKRVWK